MKTDLLRDLLYEKMFRMRAVQPWKTLAMDQIFALKIAGNTYYLQLAEHDTDRILRIHQDANDLKSCLMMLEYDPASGDSHLEMFAQALSQSTLICALTVQEALDGEEMKAVRTYAREHGISLRGRFTWPQFVRLVSFQPGREPEPDEEHAEEYTDSYGVVHPQPVLHSYNPAYEPRAIKFGALFQIVGRVL